MYLLGDPNVFSTYMKLSRGFQLFFFQESETSSSTPTVFFQECETFSGVPNVLFSKMRNLLGALNCILMEVKPSQGIIFQGGIM